MEYLLGGLVWAWVYSARVVTEAELVRVVEGVLDAVPLSPCLPVTDDLVSEVLYWAVTDVGPHCEGLADGT